MLIGMAIAPDLDTPADHKYGSTYTVYLDNFSLKSLLTQPKKAISECKLVSLCKTTLIW
ncbi:hypothetical protein [uncultured Nostoc sp.]|uniref:hypothetical protein n=1 Tax=uncultured Nostoc sp. TaxID=340711 RepID=UPI0035CC96CF